MSEARQEVAAPRTPLRAHDPGSPPSRQRLWCGTTGPVAHCPRTHPAQTRARVLDLTSTIQTHGTQNRLRACVRTGPPCCCCCCLLLLRCGMLARARQAPAPSARQHPPPALLPHQLLLLPSPPPLPARGPRTNPMCVYVCCRLRLHGHLPKPAPAAGSPPLPLLLQLLLPQRQAPTPAPTAALTRGWGTS